MTARTKNILLHDTLGRLEFDADGLATTTLLFGQEPVTVDVTFTENEITAEALERPGRLGSDLATLDRDARRAISENLASRKKTGRVVHKYRSDLFKQLDAKVLTQHFGVAKLAQVNDERFVAGLRLDEVTIFVEANPDDSFFACDYTVGRGLTNSSISVILGDGTASVSIGTGSRSLATPNNTTAVLKHPALGQLEFDENRTANTTLMLGQTSVPLDISFPDGERPTAKALARSGRRVTDLTKLDADARKAIAKDLALGEEGEAMHLYKTHHFEELDAATLAERFGITELAQIDDARFIAGLQLVRVGLYPKEPDATFVCDYTLGADLTDYIIAVTYDNRGRVRGVAMES
jgi:hypothetical protein